MNTRKNCLPVSAVIVHFRTFELTQMAVWSLKSHYPDMDLVVVENNSSDGSLDKLLQLADTVDNVSILPMDKHVHHGPGMNAGILKCHNEWVLICDSDCIVYRPGVIETMFSKISDNTYMVGEMHKLDKNGFFADSRTDPVINYIHPHFALVRKNLYTKLPPFEKHGAPCLNNEIQARNMGFDLIDFPVVKYVYHIERGTVDKFGYGLGIAGQKLKINKFLNRISGAFRK